ncbi:UDP-N-acetylmuramoyl-tripeptide--D-alanyl-D-alanine ligase [Paenibacillus harenae]|uniref:UDP-N-acetylmuramoyl-tripeptide--D-alanyl-D- alanine ligase n=1 Tax=Paenibacillus harenae TaxID=306543 RepID=UPI00041A305E|nr:UDP-N-acetylmuramoyl-tripeptide--D-alanyl-D-alanine ligase [Paenibacillus harenae]
MIRRSLQEIVQMTDGTELLNKSDTIHELSVHGVSIDSRTIVPGNLFIPIIRLDDGHKYVQQAVEKGAAASLWQIDHGPPPSEIPIILVDDTFRALHTLAMAYRNQIPSKIIGVTGSNGKTTVKDMISSVLGTQYKVYRTYGNLNGEYGLPLSILEVEEGTEVVVLEMGMNNKGEISILSKIAKPDIGIITMIGVSHLSTLGSREGIAQAKLEILDGLNPEGTFILNGDESLLIHELEHRQLPETLRMITFGVETSNDYYSVGVEFTSSGLRFSTNKHDRPIRLSLLGSHNVLNALITIAVADLFDVTAENMQQGLLNLRLSSMRMERIQSEKGFLIINDAWNASPISMNAAIDTVQSMEGYDKIIFILGDMLELGERERLYHVEVANSIDFSKVHAVYTYGEISKVITDTLASSGYSGVAKHFTSKAELADECNQILGINDVVLIKGSRGLKLEDVCSMLG